MHLTPDAANQQKSVAFAGDFKASSASGDKAINPLQLELGVQVLYCYF